MAKVLFTRLPFSVPDSSLPVIDSADIQLLVDYETESFDHWLFNNGSASLVGLKAATVLTPQTDAPTFSATNLILNNSYNKALLSEMDDAAEMCIAMVIKRRADLVGGDMGVLSGTLGISSESPAYGGSLFESVSHALYSNTRGIAQAGPLVLPGSVGEWVFVAQSEDGVLPSSNVLYVGGVGTSTASSSTNKRVRLNKVALGCAYYNNSAVLDVPNLEVAEFILFPRALSITELNGVYERSKIRLANTNSGITVI